MIFGNIARVGCGVILAALTACSGVQHQAPPGDTAPHLYYTDGVIPPARGGEYASKGLYPSTDPRTCCFLGKAGVLWFKLPSNSHYVLFKVYLPNLAYFHAHPERIAAKFDGHSAGISRILNPGLQDVVFALPTGINAEKPLRVDLTMSSTYVPRSLGINGDTRELSLILESVRSSADAPKKTPAPRRRA